MILNIYARISNVLLWHNTKLVYTYGQVLGQGPKCVNLPGKAVNGKTKIVDF